MKTKFCSTVMLFCLLAINFSCASAGEQLASPNGKVFLSVSITVMISIAIGFPVNGSGIISHGRVSSH